MSSAARRTTTVGEIVNLMSVDAQKFQDTPAYMHMIWSTPLTIALALYMLYQFMGPSVFAGLAAMLLLVPINGYVANKTKFLQVCVVLIVVILQVIVCLKSPFPLLFLLITCSRSCSDILALCTNVLVYCFFLLTVLFYCLVVLS